MNNQEVLVEILKKQTELVKNGRSLEEFTAFILSNFSLSKMENVSKEIDFDLADISPRAVELLGKFLKDETISKEEIPSGPYSVDPTTSQRISKDFSSRDKVFEPSKQVDPKLLQPIKIEKLMTDEKAAEFFAKGGIASIVERTKKLKDLREDFKNPKDFLDVLLEKAGEIDANGKILDQVISTVPEVVVLAGPEKKPTKKKVKVKNLKVVVKKKTASKSKKKVKK